MGRYHLSKALMLLALPPWESCAKIEVKRLLLFTCGFFTKKLTCTITAFVVVVVVVAADVIEAQACEIIASPSAKKGYRSPSRVADSASRGLTLFMLLMNKIVWDMALAASTAEVRLEALTTN